MCSPPFANLSCFCRSFCCLFLHFHFAFCRLHLEGVAKPSFILEVLSSQCFCTGQTPFVHVVTSHAIMFMIASFVTIISDLSKQTYGFCSFFYR